MLRVTEGTARVGARDGTVIEVHPGESLWTPPGEWHWHGAGPESFMTHLAMWESGDGLAPDAEWAERVSEEQYRGARSDDRPGGGASPERETSR